MKQPTLVHPASLKAAGFEFKPREVGARVPALKHLACLKIPLS